MAMAKCKICGEEFAIKPSRLKRGQGKFCSRECHHKSMREGKYVRCETCNQEIYRSPQDLRESESNKFFCSKSCQAVWRNKQFSGKQHARWKHGRGVDYRAKLLSSDVIEECVLCENSDKRVLAAHHIDEDRSNNKIENLCWLCHNCHKLVHNNEDVKEEFMAAVV